MYVLSHLLIESFLFCTSGVCCCEEKIAFSDRGIDNVTIGTRHTDSSLSANWFCLAVWSRAAQ